MKIIFIILFLLIILYIVYKLLKVIKEKFKNSNTKNSLVLSGPSNYLDFRLVLNENNPITISTDYNIATDMTLTTLVLPIQKLQDPSIFIQQIQVNQQYVTISPKFLNGDLSIPNNHIIYYTDNFLYNTNYKNPSASLFIKGNQLYAYFSDKQQYTVSINDIGIYFSAEVDNTTLTVSQNIIKPNFKFIPYDFTVQLLIPPPDPNLPIYFFVIDPNSGNYLYLDFSSTDGILSTTDPNYVYTKLIINNVEGWVISPANNLNSYYALIPYENDNQKISVGLGLKIVPLNYIYFNNTRESCDAPYEFPQCAYTLFLTEYKSAPLEYTIQFFNVVKNTTYYGVFSESLSSPILWSSLPQKGHDGDPLTLLQFLSMYRNI